MSAHLAEPLHAPGGDEWPEELRLLLEDDADELLRAVAATAGAELASWRPRQVSHQPGASTVVQYRVELRWRGGEQTQETFVAGVGLRDLDGAAVFDDGRHRLAAWRWPADPALPGLRDALSPVRVGALLDDLGIGGGAVQLRARAYRPGRRAVIEVTGRRGRLFLKVVRPDRVEALHGRHRLLAAHLPVPDSLGWTEGGVVVLPALPGSTLREALRSGHRDLPAPDAVTDLLSRLPADLVQEPPRRDLRASAEHHAKVVAATLPASRPRVEVLLDRLRAHSPTGGEAVPVHGDLYESQLLVERGRIIGLLDVDTAGAGERADDLANFCAHLSILGLISERPKPIKRWGVALLAHAEQQHDPVDLRHRIAAAVIGLATGPFRVLEAAWPQQTIRRLDLAADWLDSAERTMSEVSPAAP